MIEMQRVRFAYPKGEPLFAHFNWQIGGGDSWSVLGPSGCGKTTLLYLLAGLRRPLEGTISILGEQLMRPRPRSGLILQDYGLLPWATLLENARLGLRLRRFYGPDEVHAPTDDPVADIDARLNPWLDRLGLSDYRHHYPAELSGGQRQRTAIARTLAMEPDLLLMDEPFASLDAPTRTSLQDLVMELRREQKLTTIIVTHTIEEAALLGEKILLLSAPPHVSPLTIENSGAASASYRDSPVFLSVCQDLRQRMGESA